MILQKLVGNIYSIFIEVSLWVIPVACAVACAIVAVNMAFENILFVILGVILGLIVGIILEVFLLGPIVILLNIRSSLRNIENK
jgi:hypothetical protein